MPSMTYAASQHPILCILYVRGFLFTAFQKRSPDNRPAKPRAFAAVVLVCVALLALLTVAQVAHTPMATYSSPIRLGASADNPPSTPMFDRDMFIKVNVKPMESQSSRSLSSLVTA
jgi:hypothetical protein